MSKEKTVILIEVLEGTVKRVTCSEDAKVIILDSDYEGHGFYDDETIDAVDTKTIFTHIEDRIRMNDEQANKIKGEIK